MRTTERTIDLGLAKRRQMLPTRTESFWTALTSVFRVLRNRRDINRLSELDDHQLFDIGLTRLDVDKAMTTSTFFEDPSASVTRLARARARSMQHLE